MENPVEHIALNEYFVLQIPAWKKIYSKNPNIWEGIGITPDIQVIQADAMKTAHRIALEKLLLTTNDKTALDKYQWALDGVSASYDNVDGPYNTFTEVNYRDCFMPNSDCLMYDINCYHDYSCNDCFYNWGVYLFTLYNAHTVNHLG